MNREGDVDGILSLVGALDEATDGPAGEVLLAASAQIGKAPGPCSSRSGACSGLSEGA